MSNGKIILNLYKTKIKLCQQMGYQLGTYLPKINNYKLNKKYFKHEPIELLLFSSIKYQYTKNINIKNNNLIQDQIDIGFYVIRNFDECIKKIKYIKYKQY
jgi:hypothetical protein